MIAQQQSCIMPCKSIFKCSLAFVSVMLLLNGVGCKKGEEDPFFSIHTRKARLTGSWVLSNATWQKNDTAMQFIDSVLTVSYNNSTDTLPMQHTFDFNKDNTYKEEIITRYPSDWKGNGAPAYTLTETRLGTWKFTGGGSIPEKSQLLLQVTQRATEASNAASNVDATEYTGQPYGFVYDIVKLSRPELHLAYDLVTTYPGGTYTDAGDLNFIKN